MKTLFNQKLAEFTTIRLGGEARLFVECKTLEDLKEALQKAQSQKMKVWVMGNGSNTIFLDSGFDGLVIRVGLKGISFTKEGALEAAVRVEAAAGEDWDEFVAATVARGLTGIESLSGIPSSVGAAPVQNIGAYGQEIGEAIKEVRALDRATLAEVSFTRDECEFGYRTSRFKTKDAGKYIITAVVFRLYKDAAPAIKYPELAKAVEEQGGSPEATAALVRETVLALRKKKSMIVDPNDPNSWSCGSFFTNPMLSASGFEDFVARFRAAGGAGEVPSFSFADKVKIPAAWLIEQAGFAKGYEENGVGISAKHSLALINKEGTTAALLVLAQKIKDAVSDKFGIELEMEPVIAV